MTSPTADQAIAVLRAASCVVLPLATLAERLGYVDPDALARDLAPDPRLRVLDPPGFPELAVQSPDRAAAYRRALAAAGLRPARQVVLTAPVILPPTADIGALLRATVAPLLGGPTASGLAEAAERTNTALRTMLDPGP